MKSTFEAEAGREHARPTMNDEQAFIDACLANPDSDSPKLVFAD